MKIEIDLERARAEIGARLRAECVPIESCKDITAMFVTSTLKLTLLLAGKATPDLVLEAHLDAIPSVMQGDLHGIRTALLSKLGSALNDQVIDAQLHALFGARSHGAA